MNRKLGRADAGVARKSGQSHLGRQLQSPAARWPGARQRQDHSGAGSAFRGAGWNVIKVIWGSDWDPLLARTTNGVLVKRMEEAVDGDYQKYSVEPGSYTRKHFFGKYPELAGDGQSFDR